MIYRAIVFALFATSATALLRQREWYEGRFAEWMAAHKIQFPDGQEFLRRLEIFATNEDLISKHNTQNATFVLAHNEFSHLTWDEFRNRMNLGFGLPKNLNQPFRLHKAIDPASVPASIDWEEKGAVTSVKDQGSCGSCWAFSAVGALEGAYQIKQDQLLELSQQQLVDCDSYDYGCDGGLMDNAFKWIEGNGGLCSAEDYPYTSGDSHKQGACQRACTVVPGTAVTAWTDVETSEDALKAAVAQQPVAVAIEADQVSFQFYKEGVFTGRCGTNLDHGVLAVGYGTYKDGTDYWKVKNSWGSKWGMDGYILIQRNKDQNGGQCGIALSASYPTL